MVYLQSSFSPLLSTVYPSSQDRHNPPLYPVIYTSIPEAFRTIAERNWICIQLVVPTAIIWNKNASNVAAVDPKSSRFSQISMAAMSKWCLDLKEDRQSSFPHIRRGFPPERKKISPLNGNLYLSLLTSLVQEQGKNSIQSIFRNKPWKHTARCFIGAAIPTSTLRLTSVAFITCSRKAATLASSNENHRRNSLLSRLRCKLYYSNLASSDAPFGLSSNLSPILLI